MNRRLRFGMVGGGRGAFIGAVHRIAARLDDRYELVAGVFSSDAQRSRDSGADLLIDARRSYTSVDEMVRAESARPDRIDVAERARRLLAVTYNYSGYPLVRQAKEMIAAGELGELRLVQVEYAQDWLTTALEAEGQKQASWRTDPQQSGVAGSVGDIGTHAFHLAEFVSGIRVSELAADLSTHVAGRKLDDNAQMLLRFANGARGGLWATQVAPGNENGLRLRIYGAKGGIEWSQEEPNHLRHASHGQPPRVIARGGPGVAPLAAAAARIPSGHPEGYLEAFAQLYRDIADLIAAYDAKTSAPAGALLVPTGKDGLRGVQFVHAAVESSRRNAAWIKLES
jgi:predicted dehydrogenase